MGIFVSFIMAIYALAFIGVFGIIVYLIGKRINEKNQETFEKRNN